MQKNIFLKSIKQILESLTEEELKQVLSSEVLEKLKIETDKKTLKTTESKENVFGRLKDLGIERFNDVKESLTDTVAKLKEKKETETKSQNEVPEIVHNNPFLRMQNSNNSQ